MTRLWQPTAEHIQSARMTDFLQQVNQQFEQSLANYHDLHTWSVQHSDQFWRYIWDYFDVIGNPGSTIVEHPQRIPGAQWFPQARLNFAENLLRHRDDKVALIFRGEDGTRQQLTYAELYQSVAAL
ncbi:MAG TPA: acetyl-coenzyme A synthetase N-terminal domain-containing protein, partial [Pseudidiomarina sp.]|nr:acetyl-coenzyme A synthetase N-terminal domain-containing protein [Pseudidiomarina sp.]